MDVYVYACNLCHNVWLRSEDIPTDGAACPLCHTVGTLELQGITILAVMSA